MKAPTLLLLTASLSACLAPAGPRYSSYDETRAQADATGPVAIRQGQQVGDLVVTPITVTEDSRCPTSVECVWQGSVKVAIRIDGPGWRESAEIALADSLTLRGHTVRLVEVMPVRTTTGAIPLEEYRFRFEP